MERGGEECLSPSVLKGKKEGSRELLTTESSSIQAIQAKRAKSVSTQYLVSPVEQPASSQKLYQGSGLLSNCTLVPTPKQAASLSTTIWNLHSEEHGSSSRWHFSFFSLPLSCFVPTLLLSFPPFFCRIKNIYICRIRPDWYELPLILLSG